LAVGPGRGTGTVEARGMAAEGTGAVAARGWAAGGMEVGEASGEAEENRSGSKCRSWQLPY